MSVYAEVYRRKRTTPRKAVSRIRNGDTIVHGLTIAEPPALLNAIADRVPHGQRRLFQLWDSQRLHVHGGPSLQEADRGSQ
jgi:acyl-CoA hydrolase